MTKSIYDYANEMDNSKHISFYDVCKTLLKDIDGIICKESATDLLGFSNGGFRNKIKLYTTKKYDIPYLDCIIVNDLSVIPTDSYNGIKVTPIEKTIIDLLQDENCDSQILIETLANYYFENNNSYSKINLPKNLTKRFNFFRNEGEQYYDAI